MIPAAIAKIDLGGDGSPSDWPVISIKHVILASVKGHESQVPFPDGAGVVMHETGRPLPRAKAAWTARRTIHRRAMEEL